MIKACNEPSHISLIQLQNLRVILCLHCVTELGVVRKATYNKIMDFLLMAESHFLLHDNMKIMLQIMIFKALLRNLSKLCRGAGCRFAVSKQI